MKATKNPTTESRPNQRQMTRPYHGFNFHYGFVCGKTLQRALAGDSLLFTKLEQLVLFL
jgi:hypothetical protein